VLSGDLLAGRVTKKYIKNLTTQQITNTISKSWYHLDHLNSTKCVTNEQGKRTVLYEYRAFGEELKKLGTGDAKYTYGGKEYDKENSLLYFNARYMDPTIGRFINVDPVQSGMNWYVYANNNPLNRVDPTGLKDKEVKIDPGFVLSSIFGTDYMKNNKKYNAIFEIDKKDSNIEKSVNKYANTIDNFLKETKTNILQIFIGDPFDNFKNKLGELYKKDPKSYEKYKNEAVQGLLDLSSEMTRAIRKANKFQDEEKNPKEKEKWGKVIDNTFNNLLYFNEKANDLIEYDSKLKDKTQRKTREDINKMNKN